MTCAGSRLWERAAISLALLPAVVLAQESVVSGTGATGVPPYSRPLGPVPVDAWGAGGGTMQMLGWLIACLLLVCAGLTFFYRGNAGWRPGARGPRKLQVEETRGLGQRQFLAVVEYEGRRMLLGVCPGRIDYLCPLDGPGESAQDFQAWVPEESRTSVPGMSPESAGEAGMQAGTKIGQAGKGAA